MGSTDTSKYKFPQKTQGVEELKPISHRKVEFSQEREAKLSNKNSKFPESTILRYSLVTGKTMQETTCSISS
uniref:Uncharacterized protein n=1 Tax=Arundo donax TaxID=35708 RepID=A0A0A8Z676_ARUDO